MKKILVPINFTKVAINALKYAINLFPKDAEFTVFHAIDGNLSIEDPIILSFGLTKNDGMKKEIKDLVDELLKEEQKTITYHIGIGVGNVVDAILKIIREGEFDAVVMGTRDKYDLFDKLFGTVSLGVAKRVSLPVYMVPPKVSYHPFNKVVIASDFHLESDEILNAIEEWNSQYKAELHFVHVGKNIKTSDEDFIENIVEEFFEERTVPFSFVIDVREGKNVVEEILKYTEEQKADLQLIITDRSSWLDTITSKSITREMILKSNNPMLFIHSGMIKKSRIFFDFLTFQL